MQIVRHALSILILPATVVILVPRWLLGSLHAIDTRWPVETVWAWLGLILGVLIFAAGLALFAWCVTLFASVGRGTLAPWDPTRELVAVGPYRHVRNPMISAVATMLAGETLFFGSRVLAAWMLAFVLINHAYFLLSEERGLARRFGRSYDAYRSAVPRWIPRRRPWSGG
jgi:protein-S-isoprenylcysteine O-methyltransferase Ste14